MLFTSVKQGENRVKGTTPLRKIARLYAAIFLVYCALLPFPSTTAAQDVEKETLQRISLLEKEIEELTKKLRESDVEVAGFQKKIEEENVSFTKYQQQFQTRYSQIENERLSLQNDYQNLHKQSDSLSLLIQSTREKQKSVDNIQTKFTAELVASTVQLEKTLQMLPPQFIKNQLQSVKFLNGEISTQTIDNAEGFERLWQILQSIADASTVTEVFAGQSDLKELSGAVDCIRIGYTYFAMVDEQGTAAAMWKPASDATGGAWDVRKEPEYVSSIQKCIKMQQGNVVPEIVIIPFAHKIIRDSVGMGRM